MWHIDLQEALERHVSEGHNQPIKAKWASKPLGEHSVGSRTTSSASQSGAALDTGTTAPATSFGEHPAIKCDESVSGTDSIEAKREILEHLMAVGARLTEKQAAQRQAAQEEAARVAAEASRVAAEAAEAEAIIQAALRRAAAEEAARVAAAEASKAEAAQRQAAEEEADRVAALEGFQVKATQAVQRQAAAAEAARVAAAEASRAEAAQAAQRQAAEEEAARVAAEEAAAQGEATQAKARLANCAQRIMKLTEAAMEVDLEAASAFTHPSSIDSTPAGTAVLQLVLQNLARLLAVVDYLEGMGGTAGAIGSLSLVRAVLLLLEPLLRSLTCCV